MASDNLLTPEQGTAGSALTGYPTVDSPTAAAKLAAKAGWVRSQADAIRNDADSLHRKVQSYNLDERASAKGRQGVSSLLKELAIERGMAWTDIARLIGVSIGAVRKWRTDGSASPDNRLGLARLAAFLDLLAECAVEDPAQWMEMRLPLPPGFAITPMDLYRRGGLTALLDYASQRRTAEQVLEEADPRWRDARSDFEVYDAPDGEKAIRIRPPASSI